MATGASLGGACAGTRIENAEVSSWRLLFIVNRFAELQTVRITSPEFTLFMMVSVYAHAYFSAAACSKA